MKSFENCYRKYPNAAQKGNAEARSGGCNLYHKRALLKWGEAAQGAEDYDMAIRMYKKFLDERDKTAATELPAGRLLHQHGDLPLQARQDPARASRTSRSRSRTRRVPDPGRGDRGRLPGAGAGRDREEATSRRCSTSSTRTGPTSSLEPFEMHGFSSSVHEAGGRRGRGGDGAARRSRSTRWCRAPTWRSRTSRCACEQLGHPPRAIKDGSKILDPKAARRRPGGAREDRIRRQAAAGGHRAGGDGLHPRDRTATPAGPSPPTSSSSSSTTRTRSARTTSTTWCAPPR